MALFMSFGGIWFEHPILRATNYINCDYYRCQAKFLT